MKTETRNYSSDPKLAPISSPSFCPHISAKFPLFPIFRYLLALLFLWASISKLANLHDFYASLLAYQLPLPNALLKAAAIILPWLELFCGLTLLAGFWLRAAVWWVLILCLVFVFATGQAWARGLDISCGCLNLSLLHLSAEMNRFLESVAFAFFRAVMMTCAALYLLLRQKEEKTI